jgi:hypothetical protein
LHVPAGTDRELTPSEDSTKTLTLRFPEFGFIVGTRAALAFGAGLLMSAKIPERHRRKLGLALVTLGAASTVPAVMTIRKHVEKEMEDGRW